MLQAESRRVREALIAKLRDILPRQFVLTETEQLRPYESDGLTAYRQLPWIVVLPSNREEVEKILALCTACGVPVVARGAGTGLSGGALPHPHGVLLSMTRLDRILSVDRANRTARVQPGVRNIAISEEVEGMGLYYAPDPSSQIACSIGGNVAEKSGGVHCLKYGLTVHNILKLEVVLMSGESVTIGADALDMPGYDLLALMTGSEGMLGVVTEVAIGDRFHYELTDPSGGHHHMVCRMCNGAFNLGPHYLEEFRRTLISDFSFEPDLEHFTITGVCSDCQPVPGES